MRITSLPGVRYLTVRSGLAAAALAALALPGTASAYIGPSFLQLPGVKGEWRAAPFKAWARVNANYWGARGGTVPYGDPDAFPRSSAPTGAGSLMIAIDKRSPVLGELMRHCRDKTHFAQLDYAESAELVSVQAEMGERPAAIPEYYRYRLKDAEVSRCTVVAGAPEQGLTIRFAAIDWLNFPSDAKGVPAVFEPVPLAPTTDPRTRTFVLSWFGIANDVSDDQCPVVSKGPDAEDYYTYLSAAEADKERARLKSSGTAVGNKELSQRGPDRLDITRLPGIVPDPGQPLVQIGRARGLDLGTKAASEKPRKGALPHHDFVSPDGRTGIDNQLFFVEGCVAGQLGHRGFGPQFTNAQMRDGLFSILVQISGIDDPRNDDNVDVNWFYSLDRIAKSGAGNAVLADYSFRITSDPIYTHYFTHFHGRIVNGVVITDPLERFDVNMGKYGFPTITHFHDARLRLELSPDGGIKGVLGGYLEVWRLVNNFASPGGEVQWGYRAPAIYNALRRAADGMKDPVTGEYQGISTAYDIEGVPAFIARKPVPIAQTGASAASH